MIRILLFLCTLTVFSCGGTSQQTPATTEEKVDRIALKSALDALENELSNNTSTKIDTKKAKDLIEKSIQFVDAFPDDPMSPGYLFRTAEVSVGIKEHQKALEYWERLQTAYGTYEKAPIALFLQGFTCENHVKDTDKAKEYYNKFLTKYPDHEYADQVAMLLENIDISPEDLIKSFQKGK